jgi:hypothetical protein
MSIKVLVLGAALVGLTATGAQAADVLLPGNGVPYALTSTATYTQDFNSLKSITSDPTPANALPAGWQAFESGTGADGNYRFGTSGSNTPGVWSYGLTGERALGAHASTEVPLIYIGAIFRNSIGGVIDSLDIGYTGEQWQNGFNRATLKFQYSLDATSINNGNWTSFSDLDFLAPDASAHRGSQFGITQTDGNKAAFRAARSGLIDGLAIGAGNTFGVRWTVADIDQRGVTSDDGLGVDDFSMTATVAAVPEPGTWATMIVGMGLIGGTIRRRQRTVVRFA